MGKCVLISGSQYHHKAYEISCRSYGERNMDGKPENLDGSIVMSVCGSALLARLN